MSFISTHFVYNGVQSQSMGIHLIKDSTGMIERQFFGDREIVSEQVFGNDTPYVYGFKNKPFPVKLQLSPLEGEWTSELKNKVSRWLNNGKYNEFYSMDDAERRYYLTYLSSPTLKLTGTQQGWLDINFENIDCYVRSPYIHKLFDLSTMTSSTIQLANQGGSLLYPEEITIQKIGNGNIEIINLSEGGRSFKFTGLFDQEIVTIQNKERHIQTNISNTYRHDAFNGNYLRLMYGINQLQVIGACKISLKYQHEFISQ